MRNKNKCKTMRLLLKRPSFLNWKRSARFKITLKLKRQVINLHIFWNLILKCFVKINGRQNVKSQTMI